MLYSVQLKLEPASGGRDVVQSLSNVVFSSGGYDPWQLGALHGPRIFSLQHSLRTGDAAHGGLSAAMMCVKDLCAPVSLMLHQPAQAAAGLLWV